MGIVAGVLSVASTAASFVGQYQQAQAMADFEARKAAAVEQQRKQNAELALASYHNQLQQLSLRDQQQHESAGADAANVAAETARRRGTAQASAGDANIAGVSYDLLQSDYQRTASLYTSAIHRQLDFQDQQTFFEQEALASQTEGRIQSIQPYIPRPVQGPSVFAAALNVGSGVMYGYDRHLFYNNQGPYGIDPNKQAPSVWEVYSGRGFANSDGSYG